MDQLTAHKWPEPPEALSDELKTDFRAGAGRGRVGSKLVSESDRVRVWHLSLQPGERFGFHTHALDYFWTVLTSGRARSHYGDGRVAETAYEPGDTKHFVFGKGDFMIHDLDNIGDTELVFVTVEFLESANAPLPC